MATIVTYGGWVKASTARRFVINTNGTGQTVAVTISKNGAAFANPSAGATNATEIANGLYYVDLSTTDTNSASPLIVKGNGGSDIGLCVYQVGTCPVDGDTIATDLLDLTDGVESGVTVRQALRAIGSGIAGNVTNDGADYAALDNSGTGRLSVANPTTTTRTVTPSL